MTAAIGGLEGRRLGVEEPVPLRADEESAPSAAKAAPRSCHPPAPCGAAGLVADLRGLVVGDVVIVGGLIGLPADPAHVHGVHRSRASSRRTREEECEQSLGPVARSKTSVNSRSRRPQHRQTPPHHAQSRPRSPPSRHHHPRSRRHHPRSPPSPRSAALHIRQVALGIPEVDLDERRSRRQLPEVHVNTLHVEPRAADPRPQYAPSRPRHPPS
jgi:hypothetical protein